MKYFVAYKYFGEWISGALYPSEADAVEAAKVLAGRRNVEEPTVFKAIKVVKLEKPRIVEELID